MNQQGVRMLDESMNQVTLIDETQNATTDVWAEF